MPAGPGVEAGNIYQIGKEVITTHGTAVAATNRFMVKNLDIDPGEDVGKGQSLVGVLRPTGPRALVKKAPTLKVTADLTYEQILYFLQSSIKGAVTPSGAGAAKTWTYLLSETADPAIDTFTIERRHTDMLAAPTNTDIEIEYCFTKSFQVKANNGGLSEITADMVGRQVLASTLTGAIAIPTTRVVPGALWKLYIDDTWAGLGGTQVTADLVDFTFNFDAGLDTWFAQQGQTYFNQYVFKGGGGASCDIDLLYATVPQAEDAKAALFAKRFVRLVATGDAIAGGGFYTIQFDMCVEHDKGRLLQTKVNNGLVAVTAKLVPVYDATSGKQFQATVTNILSSLP
jgi:hypothetical protein